MMNISGLLAIICFLIPIKQEKAILDIVIDHIRNGNGVILLSVYTAENQYPYEPSRTYVVTKDSMEGGTVRTSIGDLLPGKYGLCLLDDENRSGQMEYNRLGLPAEGYGFANNARPFLTRPDYDRVVFTLGPGKNRMQLTVRYKTP
jgi:uncharacterized protein (DUF2141 family)